MKKKNLLMDEYPLLVLPSLAIMIGLNEAIALQQVHYWISNPKGGVEIDGERWVYNTYEDWKRDNFPFWSIRTIMRIFQNLEDMGLLISRQEASRDRKKYYRPHYDKLSQWNVTDCHDASGQLGSMQDDNLASSSLTETTTETNNGADAPPAEFPIDWKLGHNQKIAPPTEQEQFERTARDIANKIDFQCAGAGELALAFMFTRNIHLPDESDKIKAHRKACREMLKQKVKGEHIKQAVRKLLDGNMTVTDLFSVQRTAIDLANPAPQTEKTPSPTSLLRTLS